MSPALAVNTACVNVSACDHDLMGLDKRYRMCRDGAEAVYHMLCSYGCSVFGWGAYQTHTHVHIQQIFT